MAYKSDLSEPSGFAFGLEEGEDVALSDGALDVADDLAGSLSQELNLDLCTLTLGSSTAKNLDDTSQCDLLVHIELLKLSVCSY